MAVVITRTANPAGVTAVSNVATYTAAAIGTAASNRIVVVNVTSEVASATINSCTIGGTSMTAGTAGTQGNARTRQFYLVYPTGTTADILVTFGASPTNTQNHISVYTVTDGAFTSTGANNSTDMDATAPLTTGSQTIGTGGGMIAVVCGATDTVAKTWSIAGEDLDADVGSHRHTTWFSTTAATQTLTCTGGTDGEDGAMSWLIFADNSSPTVALNTPVNLCDSYSESNWVDGTTPLSSNAAHYQGEAQSFTGNGDTLDKVQWYLKTGAGSPTGNAVAKIYAHSGTFGTSSVLTGAALATSDNFDVSTLDGTFALKDFTFSGANRITLTNATNYVATIEYSGGDSSNYIRVGSDYTSPTHAGNESSLQSGSWTAASGYDEIFYVYTIDTVSTTPTLNFTGTDADSDAVEYEVEIYKPVATDAFTRADNSSTGMNLGASWTASVPNYDFGISSNQAYQTANTNDNAAFYSAVTLANDQYVQAKMAVATTASSGMGVIIRASATDYVLFQQQQSANQCFVYWYNSGAYTQIGSTYSGKFADNDVVRLEAIGTTVNAYINGVLVITGSNASIPASGKAGILIDENGDRIDDFECGDIVVDALSASDAGFTAGHPFASGAAKDYTVQSALSNSITYYWRVRAIDPSGSNSYGAWATTRSFTTEAAGATALKDLIGMGFIPFAR